MTVTETIQREDRAYLQNVGRFPMLSAEDERALFRRWRDNHDVTAANRLVTSHLRLVAKIARDLRGYGLPVTDLIGEGNIGLMQALKRYDPELGSRFATYAIWWIRAAMQEHVLHNWSVVKLGTTGAQKKLFFNLRRLKARMGALGEGDLPPETVHEIATTLDVPEHEVISMNGRLSGVDYSLNAPVGFDEDGDWQGLLVDESDSQEAVFAAREEQTTRLAVLPTAMRTLNQRERHIIVERRLKDPPATLETLSQEYGVSRERIRQIETRALEKLRKAMKAAGPVRLPIRQKAA
jgi:RNA polymerase sigma-32 factor